MNLYMGCGKSIKREDLFKLDEINADPKISKYKKYLAQVKHDGIWLAFVKFPNSVVRLYSRSGADRTASLPELTRNNIPNDTILIGEVGFQSQKATERFNRTGIRRFHCFDFLKWSGEIVKVEQWQRSMLLDGSIDWKKYSGENYKFSNVPTLYPWKKWRGTTLMNFYDETLKNDFEGIVVKRADTPYQLGVKHKCWMKVKPSKTWDVVITGYTDTGSEEHRKKGWIGAVEIGLMIDGRLKYVGKVGGMSHEIREELSKNQTDYLFTVMEISAFQQFKSGAFRHPAIVRLRDDKDPKECIFNSNKE